MKGSGRQTVSRRLWMEVEAFQSALVETTKYQIIAMGHY